MVYADTSFLFSLYVPDVNSASAAKFVQGIRPPLLTSDFAEFEFINALNGRIFRKELLASQVQAVQLLFSRDVSEGSIRIMPISSATLAHARRIAQSQTRLFGTRSLDVLHVAAALAIRATTFCTFDKNQTRLAAALGLRVS